MDDEELELLRDEQQETLVDLAHGYPSIAQLVAASVDVEPMNDPGGVHELACRLTADEFFERHRDHVDALGSRRLLDLVTTVASKITGSDEAAVTAASLLDATVPQLRAAIYDPEDADGTRERELRDAAALVLAADALQRVALD